MEEHLPFPESILQVPSSLLEKGGLTPEHSPEGSFAAELQDILLFSRAHPHYTANAQ